MIWLPFIVSIPLLLTHHIEFRENREAQWIRVDGMEIHLTPEAFRLMDKLALEMRMNYALNAEWPIQ